MYAVAQAMVLIPATAERLKKQGYSATIILSDVWPLTYPANQAAIAEAQGDSSTPIPIIYLTLVKDDDPF